jgi:hypothetical protein
METFSALVDSIPDSDRPILRSGGNTYTAKRFRRMVYKTANFLRYRGVHERSSIALADVHTPQTVFSFLGVGLLGGSINFGLDAVVDAHMVIGPTHEVEALDVSETTSLVGFEAPPEDPRIAFFEREIWSETAHLPPGDLDPGRRIFDESSVGTQRCVVSTALDQADSFGSRSMIAVRESFTDRGTPIAGILAPLIADATILLPTGDQTGTIAISSDPAPEPDRIDPTTCYPSSGVDTG